MKEKLKARITTAEQMLSVATTQGHGTYYNQNGMSGNRFWWAQREDLRIMHEVYSTTAVLDKLNSSVSVYSHISVNDPLKVAYTPDRAAGERDTQLATSIGKLLTKFYPAMADDAIQALVAEHTAELTNEVEFIEHASIAEVYPKLGGLGACMSHAASAYKAGHPVAAYDAPGIRLAVLRDIEGKIIERTLVYEASDTDKRFIRCYPANGILAKRLKKNGYVPGAWHGAKFNTLKATGVNVYVVPYLDGYNDCGGSTKSMVAVLDGVLTSVTSTMADNLRELNHQYAMCATHTSGIATLKNVESSVLYKNDYFTGLPLSVFEVHTKMRVGGIEHITAAGDLGSKFVLAKSVFSGKRQSVFMLRSEAIRYVDEYDCFVCYFDKDSIAEYHYAVLDEALYGVNRVVRIYDTKTTKSGKVILENDSILVMSTAGTTSNSNYDENSSYHIHKTELVTTGPGKYGRLSKDAYAAPGVKLHRTMRNKVIHPSVHSAVILYNGKYEFSDNAKVVYCFNLCVWVLKSMPDTVSKNSAVYRHAITVHLKAFRDKATCLNTTTSGKALARMADHLYESCNDAVFGYYNSGYDRVMVDRDATIHKQLAQCNIIAKKLGNAEARLVAYAANVYYAEITAEEAPHYLTDSGVKLVNTCKSMGEVAYKETADTV